MDDFRQNFARVFKKKAIAEQMSFNREGVVKLRHTAALVLIAIATFCPSAFAESAEELLSACNPIADAKVSGEQIQFVHDFSTGECWGAFGTLQRVSRYYSEAPNSPLLRMGCARPESTRSELIAVFVEYVRRHPERRHDDFVDVTLAALQVAYPCGKTK
jgi:hypothetical protein